MARALRWSKRVGGAVGTAILLITTTAVLAAPSRAAVTPIAYEDDYAAGFGDTISPSAPGVLGNDFAVGSAYKAELVDTSLDDGTLDFHSDGSFTFDPHDDVRGEFDFDYCIVPIAGGACVSNTALVRLFNGEPYVPNHNYSTSQGAVLDLAAPGLLEGAQNRTSGDYLYIVSPPDFGTLDAQKSGAFTYTPPADFVGTATFQYCISNDADVPDCESLYGVVGTVSVYPAAAAQSFSVQENGTHTGDLYPAPSGGITFTALVTTAAQHGAVDINNDGTFAYTPTNGYAGPDSFAFCITQDDESCVSGGTSATVSITVAPLNVATTLSLSAPATRFFSLPVPVTATVTPSDATGTIAFADGGTAVTGCSAVPVSGGSATCTPAGSLPVGSHSFTAAFTGSGLYLDSTAGPAATEVTAAPTALAYTGATSAVTGVAFTASATLTRTAGGSVPLSGQVVTFGVTGDSCSGTTDGSGSAACDLTAPLPGPGTVSVTYAGDVDDRASSTTGVVGVAKIATTTAVSAAPPSGLWGTPITLTATVSAGATGTVAFDAGGVACASVPLVGTTASCTVSDLAVGTDPVTATYSGDATHAASSGQTSVVINGRPTALDYTGDTAATVGQPITASAVLTDTTAGTPVTGEPVTFTLGALSCTATTGADGSAACPITPTATSQAGTLAVTFAGDAHFASARTSAQVSVAPAATTTTLAAPADSVFTTPVILTATVAPSDGTGTVAFSLGSIPIVGCDALPLVSSGGTWIATCVTTALPVGTDSVTATFAGTADYVGSAGVATVTVAPAPTALTYTGDASGTVTEPMTVSAVLTNIAASATPLDGQSLTFELAGTTCTAVTTADGSATCQLVPSDVAQSGPLTVSFAGTSDLLASQISPPVTIAPVGTATTVTGPSIGTYSVPVTVTAVIAPSAGNGTVTFSTGGAPVDGCASAPLVDVAGSWEASCTTAALPVGTDTVTADYSGDPSYLASSGSTDVDVQIAPTTMAYTGDTSATVGEPFTARVVLSVDTAPVTPLLRRLVPLTDADPATIPVPGAPVTFTLGTLTCEATTGVDGTASCPLTATAVAQSGPVVATFAGTGTYLAARTSAAVTVSKAASTVAVTASAAAAGAGTAVTLTAVVDPTDGGGTVTFAYAGTTLCSAVALSTSSGSWLATCTSAVLPVGRDRVLAAYTGDVNYSSAEGSTTVDISASATATKPNSVTPPLASTGHDLEPLIGLGLLLLGGGVSLLLGGGVSPLGRRHQRPE